MRLMPLVAGALAAAIHHGSVGDGCTFEDPGIEPKEPFARGERAPARRRALPEAGLRGSVSGRAHGEAAP